MIISRISTLTGKAHERDLDVTRQQIEDWENGGLAQHVFAHLSAGEREFIISGSTPEEWAEYEAMMDEFDQ